MSAPTAESIAALRTKIQAETSSLPGAAGAAFDELTVAILEHAAAEGIDEGGFDSFFGRALWESLPKDGRHPTHDGAHYVALALGRDLKIVIDALSHWEEKPCLTVVAALQARWQAMVGADRFNLDLAQVASWMEKHRDDADRGQAVAHCIELDAPDEVRIQRRLAQTGQQKRVFAASWTVADDPTEIVVKSFLHEAEQILLRERRPHPLSMTHPNIIETFMLENDATPAQTFLVERRIEVLSDRWHLAVDVELGKSLSKPGGWSEIARLLVDISRALAFLADQGLVHGDVKPDNLGIRDGKFVLLDFGICRRASEFVDGAQTGSLRTRAPEVLLGTGRHTERSDVWALGATIFNALFGRFPLFLNENEKPPPVTRLKARAAFERELRRRIRRDWDNRLAPLQGLEHRALRDIVVSTLDCSPDNRPEAAEVLSRALHDLPALVGAQEGPRFRPRHELTELRRHLSRDPDEIALIPAARGRAFDARLETLNRALRAQRHYTSAAEEAASVIDVILEDPATTSALNMEQKTRLQYAGELVRRFQTPADAADQRLLEAVRDQLGLATIPAHNSSENLLDALNRAVDDVKSVGGRGDLAESANELRRLVAEG
jgi:serine/threonine protein kinase